MNCPQAAVAVFKIMCAVITEQKHPAKPDVGDDAFLKHGLTEELWALIDTCWSCDPHFRPDAGTVVNILTSIAQMTA